ncbi:MULTISPECIES: ABC transporter substrate-binding protein [unclassified Aureimonas]|uniref:ABC transporter substrate-binding protein n=1 Tax=unclassified Aureimonas TaxID=2615206 RepID=UPI0006FF96DF|nr:MULTISPECIES: ABC transporter substrate-binding protein [unclassified Aureimonas]KQT52642.1 ABC transporter substrate-binding protein [Aureimonas sp. Leaf427]KQT77686.1 ABC transporter substrate-binding protein [Aureimonas sp. Leaf460]
MPAIALAAPLLLVAPALAFPVTVENCGRTLTFDAAPRRAVVHDLNMSEMAFALGLQPQMAGVTGVSGWYKTTPAFDAAKGALPELAPKYPTIETLIAADADFFMAGWYYGMKPGGEVTPDTLKPKGIATYVLSESCAQVDKARPRASMDLLYEDELALGTIFGKESEAKALVAGWKDRIAKVAEAVRGKPPVSVFLYDSGEDKPFTAGKFAMPTALVEAAGGTNVLGDMAMSWGTTSWEDVAVKNPQFLVLLDYQDGAGYGKLLDFLKSHPAMKDTDAVRNERFLPLRYEEITPGPANVDAVEALAKALHPADFAGK